MMSNKLGITIESKVGNKRVLHNGAMGVYGDFTPVSEKTVNDLKQKVRDIQSYIVEKTAHAVIPQTYGVLVNSGNGSDAGEAFVGYDEGVDNKVRLCYATDTFLAMELTRHLKGFTLEGTAPKDGSVNVTSNGSVGVPLVNATVETPKSTLPKPVNTKGELAYALDYGWGTPGEVEVMKMLEEKVDKVCAGYKSLTVLSEAKLEQIKRELLAIILKHKDTLTKGYVFKKGSPLQGVIQEILEAVKVVIPHSQVTRGEESVAWEMFDGEVILNVYNKDGKDLAVNGSGNVSVTQESPSFTVLRKLFDLISSNIGYTKLRKRAIVEGKKFNLRKAKEQAKAPVEMENPEVSVKPEPLKQTVNELSDDYYDIYLAKAGKWGKTDKKYTVLKGIIEGLITECHVDAVSLRGIDATEVVIDWVIDGKSHTMALTKKATRVNVLEVTYDMAIAYDTDYPELVGVLIKDKLTKISEQDAVTYDYAEQVAE